MRSHRFINSQLYLVIQLVAKESKAKQGRSGMIIVGWLASQKGPVQGVVNNF